jgi:hypothetical protein
MFDKDKEYRPMIGFETLYELNRAGKIRAFDRDIVVRGQPVKLKQNPPIMNKHGNTLYATVRDEKFKNRKLNITRMIKNLFGRQRPITPLVPRYMEDFVKPINKRGRRGIPVEQYDNGKMIGVFETFALAAKAIGGYAPSISDAAYGKTKMYAGYKWKIKKQ